MEYGKFNSAEELLKGYTELEKSFTEKCQELSALKQDIANQQNDSGTSGQPSPQQTHAQSTAVDVNTVPAPENADSSTECPSATTPIPPRVMTGGGNVSMALPNRPKTLKEASELAKKYFN